MKNILFPIVIMFLVGASCCKRASGTQETTQETGAAQAPDTVPQVPHSNFKPAPDFTLVSIKGDTIRLSDYKGKVVILDFWATWCPPCREEIPHFKNLFAEKSGSGLMIIGIVVNDDVSEVKNFVTKNAVNYPIAMGTPQVERAYGGIEAIPTTFIIGKDMTIRQRVVGYREPSFFKKEVEKLLVE
ncbi:MAG: redoxin domain-containing protein [candidate division WOR-3 bacterium]